MFSDPRLLTLAAWWIGYFAVHSLLASHGIKRRLAACCPRLALRYRLFYTLTALVLILPPLHLLFTLSGPWLWRWEGWAGWVADLLGALAVVGFWISSRAYDLPVFFGLRPSRPIVTPETAAPLRFSPAHRFVRHPWYFFGLLWLWTRDMNPPRLVTAVLVTLYVPIGTWLEERKLLAELGEPYRAYRRRVPALFPLPWKYLRKDEVPGAESLNGPDHPGPG
ncbi:MAG: isoprenylcysteine carboxylmethyltransferase family protein [Gammaproteobacteria bacterium]|nr:MAG: isoprenylcysteine carboxylmethyltransferase family protein [Gammaproteobacteria bacterium]